MCNTVLLRNNKSKTTDFSINTNVVVEEIENTQIVMGPPNGGKCPNCPNGRLSFDRYGPRGEEYYSCVKCGFVVKK